MQPSMLKMHKYVLGWVALFISIAATLPVAMIRVSSTEKFLDQPFNSLTCEGKVPAQRVVTKFTACTQSSVSLNPVRGNISSFTGKETMMLMGWLVSLVILYSLLKKNAKLN